MSSKSKGANHGARRFVKAVTFSPARAKLPKKKPLGYPEDSEDEKDT